MPTIPTGPLHGDPTRTATATASPESQPKVAADQFRDPERYQILGEHGRGGLGRVSRAHDRSLGRDVAIKELISRGPIGELRFLREALITARLEHPGIVPVHEAGRWPDGTPFYAMKLVAGRPLRDLIAERTTVDQRIALLHHVIAVADAIAYAHGRNIIHRDLKPANVIVGEFGETIVIDWGLAKDLSVSDDSSVGGPSPASRDSDLTSAGAVLGTPSYMAPEQQRGEHVDQRADVYAIGTMLWELCSLQKTPPADLRQRHRLLGRAGIDKDLAVIIDKALDPDPERRYADAGALAADLKAFKSGARISARRYSPLAALAHWTRRHRTLALSVAAAMAFAVAGIVVYVQRIATERDRADDALRETRSARDELILQQAELLLQIDPTAAHDLLATYRGDDPLRRQLLLARARGLGIARMTATPHTENIFLARPLPDGSILTLGGDARIAKTSSRGVVRDLAHDVVRIFAYAEPRRLLAYACDRTAICLLDPVAERLLPVPAEMRTFSPTFLAFSPNARHFAAVSSLGQLAVWTFDDGNSLTRQYSADLEHCDYVIFIDDSTLAVTSGTSVSLVHLRAADHSLKSGASFSIAGVTNLEPNPGHHLLAIATTEGKFLSIDSTTGTLTEHAALCTGAMNSIGFVQGSLLLGYACQDGNVGIWDMENSFATVLTRIPGGAAAVMTHRDSGYLIAGGNNGHVIVYDLDTKILSTYLGHAARVLELFAPTSDSHVVVSADTSGVLRVWPLPDAGTRAILRSPTRLIAAAFLSSEGPIIGTRASSSVALVGLDGSVKDLPGHVPTRTLSSRGPHGRFALYGRDEFIELWSLSGASSATLRLLKTDHDIVTAVRYVEGGGFVSSGRDGRLVEWAANGESHRELASIHVPITMTAAIPNSDAFVLFDAKGALWRVDRESRTLMDVSPYSVTTHAWSSDGRFLAVGTSQGVIQLHDLRKPQKRTLATFPSGIVALAFSATDDQIAAIAGRSVHIIDATEPRGEGTASIATRIPWRDLNLRPRGVAFSRDREWLAMNCEDGMVWFYNIQTRRWATLALSNANVLLGEFSDDSRRFLTTDSTGQATLVDMKSLLRPIDQ